MATKTTGEAEAIRAIIGRWAAAIQAKDMDAIMAVYDPEVVAYDAVQALEFRGVAAYRAHWEYCNTQCGSQEFIFEFAEPEIQVSGDLAFAHFLHRCGLKREDGTEESSWMRVTVCYRKRNGQWRVVHEHFSAPFDMANGKALFDLTP